MKKMTFKSIPAAEMKNYKILKIGEKEYVTPTDELSRLRVDDEAQFQEIYALVDFQYAKKMLLSRITNPSKVEQLTQKWRDSDIAELPRLDTREAEREAREGGRE